MHHVFSFSCFQDREIQFKRDKISMAASISVAASFLRHTEQCIRGQIHACFVIPVAPSGACSRPEMCDSCVEHGVFRSGNPGKHRELNKGSRTRVEPAMPAEARPRSRRSRRHEQNSLVTTSRLPTCFMSHRSCHYLRFNGSVSALSPCQLLEEEKLRLFSLKGTA